LLACGAAVSITGISAMATDDMSKFTPINLVVSDVLKEIARRGELRQQLEGESVVMTDAEFITYANQIGVKL
jgi:hypothetical protein